MERLDAPDGPPGPCGGRPGARRAPVARQGLRLRERERSPWCAAGAHRRPVQPLQLGDGRGTTDRGRWSFRRSSTFPTRACHHHRSTAAHRPAAASRPPRRWRARSDRYVDGRCQTLNPCALGSVSSARPGELQPSEFDLEQAATCGSSDPTIRHAGEGEFSSVEMAVSAAASIALRTLADNRAVGITASARRLQLLTPDRGTRVEQKILHLLANVQADGNQPLAEVVLATLPKLRRGMTLCIVSGSTDREWVCALVRPPASRGGRGGGAGYTVDSFMPEQTPDEGEALTEGEGPMRSAARAELAARPMRGGVRHHHLFGRRRRRPGRDARRSEPCPCLIGRYRTG